MLTTVRIRKISCFQMFANYDESEIGALDCDEIEGEIDTDSQLFKIAASEFAKERQMVRPGNVF